MLQPNKLPSESKAQREWLSSLLLQRPGGFTARLAAALQYWRAMPRRFRRRLQHKTAATAAGAALILAMTGAAFLAPPARANAITVADGMVAVVEDDLCSLREAIHNANDTNTGQLFDDCDPGDPAGSDTIYLPAGGVGFIIEDGLYDLYYSATGLPLISDDLIIEGNGQSISRAGDAPIFRILAVAEDTVLTVNDATISGGHSERAGGGIYAAEGVSLTLTRSTVSGNRAGLDNDPAYGQEPREGYGGGIFAAGGDTTLTDTVLSGNTAKMEYCVYFDPDPRECFFTLGQGGGLFQNDGNLEMTGGGAFENYARRHGGGIAIYAGVATITAAEISGNDTNSFGGGIHNGDGDLTITATLISGNYSGNDGGGIYQGSSAAAGKLTIIESTFTENEVDSSGGAIYIDEGELFIYDSSITGNDAQSYGGGLTLNSEKTTTITRTDISGNSTHYVGGGIAIRSGSVEINDSTLTGNSVPAPFFSEGGDGGGIWNRSDDLTIVNSTIADNHVADNGGGIASKSDADLTIRASAIHENTAAGFGGGIFGEGFASQIVTNTTISNNKAQMGGGIHNLSATTVAITNSTITANNATTAGGGGGIFNGPYTTLILARSILSGNKAATTAAEMVVNFGATVYLDAHNILSHSDLTANEAFNGNVNIGASDVHASSDAGDIPLSNILDTMLADNGGPTFSHNLVDGSPAVDLVPDADCAAEPTLGVDQRGFNRPFDVPGQGNDAPDPDTCDAGAVEFGAVDPFAPVVFMSAKKSGSAGGVAFDNSDILKWDGATWSLWFDGSAALLAPANKPKHNTNAIWIPNPSEPDVVMSFGQNGRKVGGIGEKVDGTDLVWWDGNAFSLWFDGSDVGLTVKTQEKIDGLHVLPGDAAPEMFGGVCQSYLLISTQGPGRVQAFDGGLLKFSGEDVLGFCATNLGDATDGFWHMVLAANGEGMPKNATDSISLSADGETLYLTTKKPIKINADNVTGGHSVVFAFDFNTGEFSGPLFSAPANGLNRQVDGLQVMGDFQ